MKRENQIIILLLVVAGLVLFSGLGRTSIYIVDESRNAQAGWEMLQSGDYIVPQFNHGLRGHKPPLHYWLMSLAYGIGGKSAFTARFFSVVLALLLFTGLYHFAKRYSSKQVGWWVVISCAVALYLPLQLRLATPDPYLISLFGLGMMSLFVGWQEQRLVYLFAGYVLLGLAALAKGPIAPAMAGLSVLIYLLWERKVAWSEMLRFRPFVGVALFLAVAVPWYILVHQETDGVFTRAFFLEHNIDRFSSTKEGHGGSLYMTPILFIASMLPFSVLLPQAWRYHKQELQSHYRFAASIVLGFLIFFTVSRTILPSYPAPAYPFLALLLAPVLQRISTGEERIHNWQMVFLLIIGIGLPIGGYFGLKSIPEAVPISGQAFWLVIVTVGLLTATILHFRKQPAACIWTIAGSFCLLQMILLGYLFPRLDATNHVLQSRPFIPEAQPPIIAYHKFSPAYVFQYGAPIHFARTAADFETYIQQYGEQCPMVLTVADRVNDIDCDPRLQFLFQQKDLFERPVTVLYRYENDESCP
ncbi:MAG: glycosyltransferase family 39 protein [Bacteroidota bacterium]